MQANQKEDLEEKVKQLKEEIEQLTNLQRNQRLAGRRLLNNPARSTEPQPQEIQQLVSNTENSSTGMLQANTDQLMKQLKHMENEQELLKHQNKELMRKAQEQQEIQSNLQTIMIEYLQDLQRMGMSIRQVVKINLDKLQVQIGNKGSIEELSVQERAALVMLLLKHLQPKLGKELSVIPNIKVVGGRRERTFSQKKQLLSQSMIGNRPGNRSHGNLELPRVESVFKHSRMRF